MAAGLMRKLSGSGVHVSSCGVWEGGYLDPFMIQVMREAGVDMQAHEPRTFDDLDDLNVDLIIALTPESATKAREVARGRDIEVQEWSAPDPTASGETREQRMDAYRAVRDALDVQLRAAFPQAGARA